MEGLRPWIAVLGFALVAAAVVLAAARARGWRWEWWERFLSPRKSRPSRSVGDWTPPEGGGGEARGEADAREALGLGQIPLLDPLTEPRITALEGDPDFAGIEDGQGVGDLDALPEERPAAAASPSPEPHGAGAAPVDDELLVVLTILTPNERSLSGADIRRAFSAFDLEADEAGLFHHYGNRKDEARRSVFSVANVLEPGVFDVARMEEVETPGLCLFMRRPGPLPAGVAFDLMLDVGNRLARVLAAVLCDDRRCRLTLQGTQAIRERVELYALRRERGAARPA